MIFIFLKKFLMCGFTPDWILGFEQLEAWNSEETYLGDDFSRGIPAKPEEISGTRGPSGR